MYVKRCEDPKKTSRIYSELHASRVPYSELGIACRANYSIVEE